jgi:hypothetical protein
MKGIIRLIRLFISFIFFCSFPAGAAEIPVLLRLTSAAQTDTTGCNFVTEFATLAYNEVISGRTKLWDGPAKEIAIAPASLQAICTSSGVVMGADTGQLLYVYEFWEEERDNIKTRTQGFLFSARDRSGREISFGYIDYTDIETACLRHQIRTNVNGDYGSTAASYVISKNYNFNLSQLAGQVITGVEESSEILSAYRRGRGFNIQSGNVIPVQRKLIHLEITSDPEDVSGEALLSRQFIVQLDSFLHANTEFLYNNTADSLHALFQGKAWKVSRVQLTEIWRKDQSGVSTSLVGMSLYISGKPLEEIPYRNLAGLDFTIYTQPFITWLSAHDYSYQILSINDQAVGRADAVLYAKGLKNAAWNRLSDYVKYY